MEAYASGSGTIYLAADSQYIAGRDLHLHYWDGSHRVDRVRPGSDAGDECPYPGMGAFGLEQARWYFGRDALRARLTARLDDCLRQGGALAVVAPSGAGKSSLLRAGLVPDLARGALPGSRRWPCLVFTPTADPMTALATHLAALTDARPQDVARQLQDGPAEFTDGLRAALAGRQAGRLVVVVDQAEELFTLVTDGRERDRFVTALDRLARAGGPALVVYGLRADFYAHGAEYRPLREALQHRQVLVGPMDETQLREAVLFPARAVGLDVQDGLVEMLLDDLGVSAGPEKSHDAGLLPHLAHALRLTWQRRQGSLMTVAGYKETGRIERAVAESAEDAYSGLDPHGQKAAETVFRRLVHIGEGVDDTRRTVPTARLTEGLDRQSAEAVLSAFTAGRLLTRRQDTVAISHEALLRAWPRLRDWVHTYRADNLLRQQIEEDAAAWARAHHDRAHLYRGSRLDAARDWAARAGQDGAGPTAAGFLRASVRQARRATALLRGSVAALTALTLLAVAGMVAAQVQGRRADEARMDAEAQSRVAVGQALRARAESLRDGDPRKSLQLSLAAQQVEPTAEGRRGLLATLQQTRLDGASPDGALSPVDDVAVLLRGGTLLAAGGDRVKSLDLWDTTDVVRPRRLATLTGFPDIVSKVALSPDGRTLAVVTGGVLSHPPVRELSLWDLADRERPRRLPFRTDLAEVVDAAFSPDGKTLAVVAGGAGDDSGSGLLELWDTGDPASPRRLAEPTEAVDADAVRFSADGQTLVTAAATRSKDLSFAPGSLTHPSGWQLWDVRDVRRPRAVHRAPGYDDGTLAVSGTAPVLAVGRGHELTLWQFTDPAAPVKVAVLDHPARVTQAAFRPDGRALVSASDGGRTQLWDLARPDRPSGPTRLPAPAKPAAFAFSGDGGHVVVADASRTAWRWRVTPPAAPASTAVLPTGTGDLSEAAFSPDGRRLAVAAYADGVHQWDVSDPAHPRELPPLANDPGRQARTLAFNKEGTALAVGTLSDATAARGEVVFWDVSDPGRPRRGAVLATPTGVASLAFHPRTAMLVATGKELPVGRTWVAFWDTGPAVPVRTYLQDSLEQLLTDTDGQGPGSGRWIVADTPAVFSPDGRLLALPESVWDVSDPSAPVRVRHGKRPAGKGAPAPSSLRGMDEAAFSPDGHRLAADSGREGEVEQWLVGPDIGYAPAGSVPVKNPRRLVYHPGGRLLATAEQFGAVHLWDVSDPAEPALAATLEVTAADIRFSSDGKSLAVVPRAGGDVRLWSLGDLPATVTDPVGLACRIVGTGLSADEWARNASGVAYEDTCAK